HRHGPGAHGQPAGHALDGPPLWDVHWHPGQRLVRRRRRPAVPDRGQQHLHRPHRLRLGGLRQLPLALLRARLPRLRDDPRGRVDDGAADEVTPLKWRIPVRAATEGIFNVGYVYAAVLAAAGDAYMRDLSWQRLTLLACAAPGALGLCAAAFLPESPLLLAGRGDSVGATRAFDKLRRLNRRPNACIDVEPRGVPATARDRGRLGDSLRTVFGERHLRTTCALAFASFALNAFYFVGAHAKRPRAASARDSGPLAGQETYLHRQPL
ncbi:unnamed protein product, partial [Prorocentrum cordatum]